MTNSCQKGKRGEREFAAKLKEHGFQARRGQQYNGLGGDDVVVHDRADWHLEVKRVQKLNVPAAMLQAIKDAGTRTPILAHRQNRGDWLITLTLKDWVRLVSQHPPADATLEPSDWTQPTARTETGL